MPLESAVLKGKDAGTRGLSWEKPTLDAFWDGEQDARDERLAMVRLLKDSNFLSEARTGRVC